MVQSRGGMLVLEDALGRQGKSQNSKFGEQKGGCCWRPMSERMMTGIQLVGVKIGRNGRLFVVF